MTAQGKRLFDVREAAAYLNRSIKSVRILIYSGKIPIVRHDGSRKIFLDAKDLEDFINKNKMVYT